MPSAKKFLQRPISLALSAEPLSAVGRELGDVDLEHAVLPPSEPSSSGLLGVAGLLQVAGGEGVRVDDQRCRRLDRSARFVLQGRRVHRHQHVRLIAGREDVAAGEVDLEAARRRRACRRARESRPGSRGTSRGRCPQSRRRRVNSVPVSCMPSPESPQKRMVTVSISFSCLGGGATVLDGCWCVSMPGSGSYSVRASPASDAMR